MYCPTGRPLLLPVCLAALASCGGGDSGGGGTGPDLPVLTSITVSPTSTALYSAGPGSTIALTVTAKNQNGAPMTVTPVFQSRNGAVATVDAAGLVSGVAAGTTWILASATASGVTKMDSLSVLVRDASATATVRAVNFAFNPGTVDVAAGGTVTWSVDSIHHSVDFTTVGSPSDIAPLQNASASRTFPTSGSYAYHCAIHPAMTGTVRVH